MADPLSALQRHPLTSVPGFGAPRPGIQIGTYVSDGASDEQLQLLQQLAVDWAMVIVDDGRDAKIDEFLTFVRNLGAAGIHYNTYAHMANGMHLEHGIDDGPRRGARAHHGPAPSQGALERQDLRG